MQQRQQRLPQGLRIRKQKRPRRPNLLEETKKAPKPLSNRHKTVTPPQDLEVWELSQGGLPAGSTLSGIKALLNEYPEDEANSEKTKKTSTGKGKKGHPKPKEWRKPQDNRLPVRGQP